MGALVLLDGSQFAWLEDRSPTMTLLGAIDDASGTVVALHFRPAEDLHGYVTLLGQLATGHMPSQRSRSTLGDGTPRPEREYGVFWRAKEMVDRGRIELPTPGFSVPCSTN